jgi:hypothetical protein
MVSSWLDFLLPVLDVPALAGAQYFSWRNFYCALQPVTDTSVPSQQNWNKMRRVKFISEQRAASWQVDKLRGTRSDRPSGRGHFPISF